MNGAILYPTDDEIMALKEAALNVESEGFNKSWSDSIKLFIHLWELCWWKVVYNLKPLKINETVLG